MASTVASNRDAVIVPLLSIPFKQPPRPIRRSGKKGQKKKSLDADAGVNSVIPSLMSLSLDPPMPSAPAATAVPTVSPFFLPVVKQKKKPPSLTGYVANQVPPLLLTREEIARSTVDGLGPLLRRGLAPHDRIEIVEVERTNKTRREFAQIARDVTRECFEPPAGSRILFAYYTFPTGKRNLIGVSSFQDFNPFASKAGDQEDLELFTYDFYHQIHYIFILRDYRGFGYGSRMVAEMERRFNVTNERALFPRPIRLQASTRAVAFFEAPGYRRVGVGRDSVCCGAPLFKTLYNMVKD